MRSRSRCDDTGEGRWRNPITSSSVGKAGPFLSYFFRDRRAHIAGVLPLLLMLIVAFAVNSRVGSAFEDANPYGAQAPRGSIAEMQAEAQKEARAEMMKAVSLGLGAYISLIASLYFAGTGVKKFLVAKVDDAPVYEKTKRAAA